MPNPDSPSVAARLDALRAEVAALAAKHGREPADVTILAVSKTKQPADVQAAYAAGARDFGENFLQDAETKLGCVPADARWHFIGALQSNKTRRVAEQFDFVHTVDRLKIARRLSEQRPEQLPPLSVCVQVNLDDEPQKAGVNPGEALALARAVAGLPRIRLRGLMAIPRPAEGLEAQRAPLAALRKLYEAGQEAGLELDTLSMGMTADMEAAIAEGATMIRIGTAIFGPRERKPA